MAITKNGLGEFLPVYCPECGEHARVFRYDNARRVGVFHSPDCQRGDRIRTQHPNVLVVPNSL